MDTGLLEKIGGKPEDYPGVLEARFRRVFDRIVELWGSPDFDPYVSSLFINDRSDRQGFPEDAMSEILRMSRLHDAAMRREQDSEAWEHENAKRGLAEIQFDFTGNGFVAAVEKGRDDALELFLRSGMDIDTRNNDGWTPLMMASFNGSEKAAERLVGAGAAVNARDNSGYTPLHWSAVQGYEIVVELLLGRGAKPNDQSLGGITPLIQAAAGGHIACVAILLGSGAKVQLADNKGWTPLHKAVANRHIEVVSLLVGHGADPFAEHESGTRPIDIAKSLKAPELLQALTP